MNYFAFLHTQIVSAGFRLNALKIKCNLKAAAKSMQQFLCAAAIQLQTATILLLLAAATPRRFRFRSKAQIVG